MDYGHELTDKKLKALEKKVAREYKTAAREMEAKLQKYLEETEVKRQYWEQRWKSGEITKEEYTNWYRNHTVVGKRWEQMRDTLAEDMQHTNEIALKIAHNEMPDVYALNANYEMYHIEHSGNIETSFTLYNHNTAEYLLGDQRQLMPKPSSRKAKEIAADKSMQWNKQKIQSAVLQGILQGEHPNQVAQRLQSVAQMNYNDAVRYARTMTTSAQNAGRYEAIHEATRLGVDLTIEWQAVLDHRTRHEHRQMHGQRREVDEPFQTPDGYTIYYPADCTGQSTAPQKEIWNCRCTLLAWVKGYEPDTVTYSPKMGDMTYEEWLEEKPKSKAYPQEPKKPFTSNGNPVTIKSSDIAVPHSLGAKRAGENILDLETGERFDLVGGSHLQDVTIFAGKGTSSEFREAEKFAERYGGRPEDWQHVKAIGLVETEEGDRKANIHWSQCEGIGRKEMFIKEWLD